MQMECGPANDDFQCVKDIIDGMISKISCEQPGSSKSKTEDKEANKSRFPLHSKLLLPHEIDRHVTSEDDHVSKNKSSDCKFREVLNSLFDNRSTTDGDNSPEINKHTALKRNDYIPLSCPVIKNCRDDILSEKDKSFIMFLDDMRSLTTDEKSCAMTEKYPVFHIHSGKYAVKEVTEKLPASDQMLASSLLTVKALLNSQESEDLKYFDSHNNGDEHITASEGICLLSRSCGSQSQCNANTFWSSSSTRPSRSLSQENCEKEVKVLGCTDALKENVSSLNLDNLLVDNIPFHTKENVVDESVNSQKLFKESNSFCCLDQFVDRQLQNVYDAFHGEVTDYEVPTFQQILPNTEKETTCVTTGSFTAHTPLLICHTRDCLGSIEYGSEKKIQQCHNQSASQSKFDNEPDAETTNFQARQTSSLRKKSESAYKDETQFTTTTRHQAEQMSKDSESAHMSTTDIMKGMSENMISHWPVPTHLSDGEQSAEQTQLSKPGENFAHEIIKKKCDDNINGIIKAEHVLWDPEVTTENNNSDQTVLDLKENIDILSVDTENSHFCEALEIEKPEQHSACKVKTLHIKQDHTSPSQKDNGIGQMSDIHDDSSHTEEDKNNLQEDPCSWQESSGSSLKRDAEFKTHCYMPERSITQSRQQGMLQSKLSATEDTRTHTAQKQREPDFQQFVTTHQAAETSAFTMNEDTQCRNLPYAPYSSDKVLCNNEHNQETRNNDNPEQCTSFQAKVTDKASDQHTPYRDHLVPDELIVFQEKNYMVTEPEESLYKTEEGSLKEAKLPSPEFKWKYRPSCDVEDDIVTPVDGTETLLGTIQPLVIGQCSRSLRIGLSRKQKVKRLHKNVN